MSEEVTNGWVSWRPLMKCAIEAALRAPGGASRPGGILELGAGDGSTAWLAKYWPGKILTLDSDEAWVGRFAHLRSDRHRIVKAHNWDYHEIDNPPDGRWAIALIDHAPGERRPTEIKRLAQCCDVLIVHDTEEGQARAGYGYDSIWHLFKHLKHDMRLNTWATALSNFVSVGDWNPA